ncbi:major vault protein-like [Physella acuta]|uniref:major vault protein-like n=1 Tax=Physella acuta TaxID=109671 RepID=UPI0027DE4F7F|nr:major vault protein-like [Physella acuta]
MSDVIRIQPLQFVHVLDLNKNVVHLVVGPNTLMLKSNHKLVAGPLPMIVVPPGSYCVVNDPMRSYVEGQKCELDLGQRKIKFHSEPFPLYPGEHLSAAPSFGNGSSDYSPAIKKLPVVKANFAIRLVAVIDHDDEGTPRQAGDRWQLRGPLTYKPRPEVDIEKIIEPTIIKTGQVLKLRAIQDTTDSNGKSRVTGEEWLVKEPGAYLPGVFEEVISIENVITLTNDIALHLRATHTLIDLTGKKRQAGEEWLLTNESLTEYTIQVGVEVVEQVKRTVIKKGQYAVILNPVDQNGCPRLGQKELRTGLCSFFLKPGETLEDGGIQNARVLSEEDSILLQALDSFVDKVDGKPVTRKTGDYWLIRGPLDYIPPINVKIVKQRKTIPLSKNEGVYVQDMHSGKVRLVMGPCAYMLTATEELWKKELSEETEKLLSLGGGMGSGDIRKLAYYEQSIDPSIAKGRDKTRVVTYRCPSNTAVQVYDYTKKTARVVFGPDLVVLGPHENFNVLSLSAGKPKKEGALKSLCLMLGPDFISDIIEVETTDHARLRLQLAFNNHFEVDKTDVESAKKIFSVPDFIGFACRQIGSRIRGSVALTSFDSFHKYSAQIIQAAVFGKESALKFDVNNLVVSSVDIQSIEPVDAKMRDSLSKSVQLAIEISTKSIEAAAAHEAKREEQMARGQLERQILKTEKEAERARTQLYELRALAAAVESTGQAKAEAQAQAERLLIEAESHIEGSRLKAQAAEIEHEAMLTTQTMVRNHELDYQKKQNSLIINKQKSFAHLEVAKFSEMVKCLGPETLVAIANAGPATQLKMLQGLGIESCLLTDGNSPINLLTTASGLVGHGLGPTGSA